MISFYEIQIKSSIIKLSPKAVLSALPGYISMIFYFQTSNLNKCNKYISIKIMLILAN